MADNDNLNTKWSRLICIINTLSWLFVEFRWQAVYRSNKQLPHS